jgi:hypothetical protein
MNSLQVSYAVAPIVASYELAVLELLGPVDAAHPQPVQSDYSGTRWVAGEEQAMFSLRSNGLPCGAILAPLAKQQPRYAQVRA